MTSGEATKSPDLKTVIPYVKRKVLQVKHLFICKLNNQERNQRFSLCQLPIALYIFDIIALLNDVRYILNIQHLRN